MGLIHEEIIAQVIDRCDIVQIIGSYVPLKKAGRNFKGHCPFHHEKTPSFMVNPDKQIFHCFGCDVGGNVVGFIMKQERLEFPEAVRMLAGKVNIAIPETNRDHAQTTNMRQLIFNVNTLAAEYFHKNLISDKGAAAKSAREYLKKRKVSLQTVEKFQIGFASDEWDGLITYLRGKKINLGLMEKAGLILAREKGDGYYDRFRNRIIFPILDTQAHHRAFGARAIKNTDGEGSAGAKYINSPETPVYIKGQHLYGFHLAKQAIGQQDFVIIVEGYMDCIMPFQAGVSNIVASLGTALTVEQIRLLHRYTKNVVMLFDMDPAGESAMLRSLDTLIEEGMNVKVAALADGHDPDSFIREYGVEAFRKQVNEAQTLFEYKLGIMMKRYDVKALESKARISGEMLQTIDKFENDILRAGYIKRLGQALMVPEQALMAELKKVRQMTGEKKAFGKVSPPNTPVVEQVRVVESDVLRLLLEEESFIAATKDQIAPGDFQDKRIREVISKIYDLFEQGKEISGANLINSFTDPDMQNMISQLMVKESVMAGDKKKMHADYMSRMKKDRVKLQMKGLQAQIGEAESSGDQNKLDALIKEYNQLLKEVAF
ncbi:MAG TPA: DNA primase [Candidatus Omnitrophota bacterium]|nr:DNA primase [Candidatus Omnitrophota bacterium]